MSMDIMRFYSKLQLNTSILFFILTFISFINIAKPNQSANLRKIQKETLDDILGDEYNKKYDKRIRPSGSPINGTEADGPTYVEVNMLIRSISRIDDVAMEYAIQITFREKWLDERLSYKEIPNSEFITLTELDRIWKPDLFFRNEKSGHFHDIITPNILLRIYPNGTTLLSIRISLVLFCPMRLENFPLDMQTCKIEMASYGYTESDLKFVWKEERPIQLAPNLTLPRFQLYIPPPLDTPETEVCSSAKTATGAYSCIRVLLKFKREFSYYLIQIYFPCVMLVIVSWVSFWLDPNAIPARVSLGVTTLLTMATQISGINASLPPVSYIKAIDVWTESCLTFVFGALLEFALVNYASRTDAHRASQRAQKPPPVRRKSDIEQLPYDPELIDHEALAFAKVSPLVFLLLDSPSSQAYGHSLQRGGMDELREKLRVCEIHSGPPRANFFSRWLSRFPNRSKQIDVLSRICFPLCFMCFNVVYWTKYWNAAEKY